MSQIHETLWVVDPDTGEKLFPAMAGGISIGGGSRKQKARSENTSGVDRDRRDLLFDLLIPTTPIINDTGHEIGREADTGRRGFLQGIVEEIMQFTAEPPKLALDNRGLTQESGNLLSSMIREGVTNQFNKLSGSGALRGQLSPANTSALIGSATERATAAALPQFLPISQSNQLFNATSTQNTRGQSIQFLQGLAGLLGQLSAAGGEGNQSARGSGFQANLGFLN